MSEFGLVVLFYIVCWQINKFRKQKVQAQQDINLELENIEEYSWKVGEEQYTLNFSKMTYSCLSIFDGHSSNQEFILSKKMMFGIWL